MVGEAHIHLLSYTDSQDNLILVFAETKET